MKHSLYRLLNNRLTIPHKPFYRAYPYRNGVSINSADSRGCVDLELGFFCNRIPKAANSTVTASLARYKLGHEVPSRKAKKLFLHPSQLSSSQVQMLDQWFRFTIVRNPYTRTLSAYLDKVERHHRRGKNVPNSFAGFLDSLAGGALCDNAHWAPQHALLLLPLEKFDFIGRVESLDQDMAYIRQRILGEDNAPAITNSVLNHATGAVDKLKRYYDAYCVERVQTLFRQDFEAFGYSLELPVSDPAAQVAV